MRKLLSYILIFILAITSIVPFGDVSVSAAKAVTTTWPSAPDIYGKSAVLIEASTGTILFNKKCHKKMYPASITKIMTALLTIENCSLDETVVFSENAVNSLSYDDANIGCQVGEEMTVKDCLYGLMLSSANEVATALGEHIAGSIDKFTEMMNERAIQAGATDTHFANANGLHDVNHYVTAYDMAMITREASRYSLFNEIVNTTTYTIPKNNMREESFTSYQRHKMIWPTSGYYYDDIIGGKTGFTDQAGTTLVTYAERNGMTLICVVLKSSGTSVYNDTKLLLDYGFDNFSLKNISENDSRFSESDIQTLQSPFCDGTDTIYLDTASNVVVPNDADFSQLTAAVEFESSDNSFATITYNYGNRTVGSAQIMYSSTTYQDNAENATTNNDSSDEETTVSLENNTQKDKKTSFKLPGFILPVAIVLVIVILLIVLITIQRKKINRIRAMKRHRKR